MSCYNLDIADTALELSFTVFMSAVPIFILPFVGTLLGTTQVLVCSGGMKYHLAVRAGEFALFLFYLGLVAQSLCPLNHLEIFFVYLFKYFLSVYYFLKIAVLIKYFYVIDHFELPKEGQSQADVERRRLHQT